MKPGRAPNIKGETKQTSQIAAFFGRIRRLFVGDYVQSGFGEDSSSNGKSPLPEEPNYLTEEKKEKVEPSKADAKRTPPLSRQSSRKFHVTSAAGGGVEINPPVDPNTIYPPLSSQQPLGKVS